MEAFPAGGFFAGKNFVFDERVTVGGGNAAVLGRCLACAAPHDSYEPRVRCARCRMLVLVCPVCAAEVRRDCLQVPPLCRPYQHSAGGGASCWCCQNPGPFCSASLPRAPAYWAIFLRFYRILMTGPQDPQRTLEVQCERCLGRTGQEDAPGRADSALPDSGEVCQDAPDSDRTSEPATPDSGEAACAGRAAHAGSPAPQPPKQAQRRRLRILCLHGFRQSASSFRGRTAALAKRLAPVAELIFLDAPHPLPFCVKPRDTAAPAASPEPASVGAAADCMAARACGEGCACGAQQRSGGGRSNAGRGARPRRAWLLEPCQVEVSKVTSSWHVHGIACERASTLQNVVC